MTHYFYENRIKSFDKALDKKLYAGYVPLTVSQLTFWQANPQATPAEIKASKLMVLSDEERFKRARSERQDAFYSWSATVQDTVHEFSIGEKTIKLKANDKTKSNLQDLKGTLDDMIALGIFSTETQTFDAFYNEGETAPISITYQELLQTRVHIAGILQNLYIKMKTVPAQINAIELADYDTLDDATAALDAVTWE